VTSNFEERQRDLEDVPPKRADKSTWPDGIRGISLDEMDALGVDKKGLLYWHGKPIEIRKTVELRKWEFALALMVAVGTIVQATTSLFPFIPAWLSRKLGF
jgi:hypothetical protein